MHNLVVADVEAAAALLDDHPDYKVLRVLPPLERLVLQAPEGRVRKAVVLDTETTSLDATTGSIIELAICPIDFDARGRIVGIGPVHDWLEDPGHPLSPEIAQLTGLSDADLHGQSIDDAAALDLLAGADVIIAHNARFDAAWIERRYPVIAGKPWCCSLRDVDWRGHGAEGRQLGALLGEVAGFFNQRHRADADVAALVALLLSRLPPGHAVSTEMFLTAMRPTIRLAAIGAPFEAKDALRQRGFRWDPKGRFWSIEIRQEAEAAERTWLAEHAGCPSPASMPVTWFTRHRA